MELCFALLLLHHSFHQARLERIEGERQKSGIVDFLDCHLQIRDEPEARQCTVSVPYPMMQEAVFCFMKKFFFFTMYFLQKKNNFWVKINRNIFCINHRYRY